MLKIARDQRSTGEEGVAAVTTSCDPEEETNRFDRISMCTCMQSHGWHAIPSETECLVSEEDMPLPLWFQAFELRSQFSPSDADKEGWFGSLRRRASLKGRDSLRRGRAGSLRRAKKEKDPAGLKRKDSFGSKAKDAVKLSKKEKRE